MAIIPGTLRLGQVSTTPPAPPAGYIIFYTKTDNILYFQDSGGVETPIGTASGITSLTGDVTGTGPGAATVTVVQVGGKTATEIANAVDDVQAATASNTPDAIVKRDGLGNFAANIITASLSGVASGNVAKSGDTMTGPLIISSASGNALIVDTDVLVVDGALNRVGINKANPTEALEVVGNIKASGTIIGSNISGTNTGDVTVTDSSNIDLSLTGQNISADLISTGVTAGTYGNSSTSASFTVDVKGRISSASESSISITSTQVSDFNEAAQDAFGGALTDTDTVDLTYNDGSNLISADVKLSNSTIISDSNGIKVGTITDSNISAGINANKISSGIVSNTEFDYLDGTTSNIQTQIDSKLNKSGDTMTGTLNMSGNGISNLLSPTLANDAANKDYVDNLAVGIIPQDPVLDPDLIDDSLSTPPVSPVTSTTYLIGPAPTGAWAVFGAGHLVYWDGAQWQDGLGRAIQIGDRLGVGFQHLGVFGGNFTGQAKKIAVVTGATPGFYAYTFISPMYRWTVNINNVYSDSNGETYYYNGTSWVLFSSGISYNAGDALSIMGNNIDVLYDAGSLELTLANELKVSNHASKHLPSGSDPITTASAITLDSTTVNGVGSANSLARSDHSHTITTASAIQILPDQSNSAGTASGLAKADHTHNIPSGVPVQIGTSNFQGAAASFALSDHVHSHGNQTNGSLHAIATGSVNGFMSSTDKTKLDASTSSNTPSTLVLRDSSGNFSAGTITANLTGNVSGSSASFTGNLVGDVTGTQGATIVSTVGGKTASAVAQSVTDTQAATDANTASTIVKRDSVGNFITSTIELTKYLTLDQATAPGAAPSGKVRIYDEVSNGFDRTRWVDANGTIFTQNRDNYNVTYNNSGSTINKGQVVYISGNNAGAPTIALAKADVLATSNVYGVALEGITNNSFGRVQFTGVLQAVDTSTLTAGQVAYLSATTAGALTNTPPVAPFVRVVVGVATTVAVSGVLVITPQTPKNVDSGTSNNSFKIGDGVSGNKSVQFNSSGVGTLQWNPTTTRTVSLPDADGQIAYAQMVTAFKPAVVALTDGATISTDASLGNVFTVTLGGNRTLANPTNPVDGQKVVWRIRQDATGSRTLAFGTAFNFPASLAGLSLSTSANAFDYLGAQYNSVTSKWDVLAYTSGL